MKRTEYIIITARLPNLMNVYFKTQINVRDKGIQIQILIVSSTQFNL